MPHRLVIRYRGAGAALSWLSLDAHGRVLQAPGAGGAPDPSLLDSADEIVVLVPGAEVMLARTEIPARGREQLERALPFALEEQLVEPVEAMHFAYRLESDGGQGGAAGRRASMEAWVAEIRARGV